MAESYVGKLRPEMQATEPSALNFAEWTALVRSLEDQLSKLEAKLDEDERHRHLNQFEKAQLSSATLEENFETDRRGSRVVELVMVFSGISAGVFLAFVVLLFLIEHLPLPSIVSLTVVIMTIGISGVLPVLDGLKTERLGKLKSEVDEITAHYNTAAVKADGPDATLAWRRALELTSNGLKDSNQ